MAQLCLLSRVPESLAPPPGRARAAAAPTPPPSFLPCARSPPSALAPSLVRRRFRNRPPVPRRSGRGALRAEPRAVAPRGDSMDAHYPALGLLLLLLCPAQVSAFQRPGQAGRNVAGRCDCSGDPRRGSCGRGEVGFPVQRRRSPSPPVSVHCCPVLWERMTARASI